MGLAFYALFGLGAVGRDIEDTGTVIPTELATRDLNREKFRRRQKPTGSSRLRDKTI